ncbi:MAG: ABC transporter substrate-binding protein [Candidatus Dormibacteraeota bacterium]|nr:ABC transporter substrate-binding protein [Candidatus Dormibacteraeota bacterium]
MTPDYPRQRRFTIALATAVAGTLVLSAATAVALRAYGVGTVRVGHGAIAGTTGTTTTGPGSAGSGGNGASAGSAGGANRPVVQGGAGKLTEQGVSGGVIHLGSIVTQTGPGRSISMAHALVAWEKTVNASGGINGLQVSIDIKDDQGNPDLGASEYRQLNEDEKVFAMVAECAPITDAQEVGYIRQSNLPVVGDCQSSPPAYSLPTLWVGGPTPYQNGQLGAELMERVKSWPTSGAKIALVCLQDPSTSPVCDGVAHTYPRGALWHGGPQYEQITDNNYSQLIAQWQSDGVGYVHLVLDPGSVQRYLYAAQAAGFSPATMNNLIVDDGDAGSYSNAQGMMIGTPWIPLDHGTAEMSRFTTAMHRYFPDDRIDLYAQTGWISALMLEHALRQMGTTITRQNLIDTLNTKFRNWNTQFGPVENFSPTVHNGPFESALMAVQGAGTSDWRLVTVHEAING